MMYRIVVRHITAEPSLRGSISRTLDALEQDIKISKLAQNITRNSPPFREFTTVAGDFMPGPTSPDAIETFYTALSQIVALYSYSTVSIEFTK